MRLRRPNCRSLRDLFCIVIAVATLSILATYHLSKHLPPRQPAELNIRFKGRVDIYRNIDPPAGVAEVHRDKELLGERRQGLEGMDVENWEKRSRERRKKKDGVLRHKLRPELLQKLKQVCL